MMRQVLLSLRGAGLALVALAISAGIVLADGVQYTYDPLGRLTRVTYDNGASIVYTYDGQGNRTSQVVTAPNLAIFHGQVRFFGRPPAPDPSWAVLLKVDFLTPGTNTIVATFTTPTDTSGNFTVASLTPATYDVNVKFAQALSKRAPNQTLVAGDNASHDFGVLAIGDVNNDDSVDIVDFSILRTTFGLCAGQSGYDPRADLNADTCVDIVDFSLLRTNFGQFGPQPG